MKKEKVFIKGFNSCSMRRFELEHYRRFILAAGHTLVDDPRQSTIILAWTCAFRNDVAANTMSGIKELKKYAPASRIIAAGCLPSINIKILKEHFDGEILPWKEERVLLEKIFHAEKGLYESTREIFIENAICENAAEYRKTNPYADVIFHDEYCKILVSEGCPFECSYCSERHAFPPYRSFKIDHLIKGYRHISKKESNRKVVFIADCLGEYGKEFGSSLPDLIEAFSDTYPQIKIALANLHPRNYLEYFNELNHFIEKGIIDHLNLPIQSASNKMLENMKRGYTVEGLEKIIDELNKMNFTRFDTHLICGFWGETIDSFTETIEFVKRWAPRYVLLSRYYHTPNAIQPSHLKMLKPDLLNDLMDWAVRELNKKKIITNIEGSNFATERLRRLNSQEFPLV